MTSQRSEGRGKSQGLTTRKSLLLSLKERKESEVTSIICDGTFFGEETGFILLAPRTTKLTIENLDSGAPLRIAA